MKIFKSLAPMLIILGFGIPSFCLASNYLANVDGYLPGYIITTERDTIDGFIILAEHNFNSSSCAFKKSLDAPSRTYTPTELAGYVITNKKQYLSHNISPQGGTLMVFLECIVDGKASLYFYKDRFFMKTATTTEELITQKSDLATTGGNFSIDLPVYKGTLQKEMTDCSTIHQDLKNTAFDNKHLKQLFLSYNDCVGAPVTVFESDTNRSSVKFGLSLGALVSWLNVSSGDNPTLAYYDGKASSGLGLIPSLWVEFSSPARRIGLRTGLSYYGGDYRIYNENIGANLSHELTVKSSRIEIPVQLKYNLNQNHSGIYALAGLGLNGFLKWEDKEVTRVLTTSYVLSESSDLENNKSFINFSAGLGYALPLGKHSLFVETSYGWGPLILMSFSGTPSGTITALTLSAGIMF